MRSLYVGLAFRRKVIICAIWCGTESGVELERVREELPIVNLASGNASLIQAARTRGHHLLCHHTHTHKQRAECCSGIVATSEARAKR